MPRKLKRKNPIKPANQENPINPKNPINSQPVPALSAQPKKIKKIKRYKKQRCAFWDSVTSRGCKRYAVGKGTLCKRHGGISLIKENLIGEDSPITMGPYTKFNPACHPIKFIEYSKKGLSLVEIAAKFQLSAETLLLWTERFEMFHQAHEIGKALHEAWWLKKGKTGLTNRSFNAVLFKFLTGNKLGYSEKIENRNMNMNIHGVLAVPNAVSAKEWEDDENEDT